MIREKVIVGEGTEYPLNGMLTIPEGSGRPLPAVVMVHGSGASNMDEKVMTFKNLCKIRLNGKNYRVGIPAHQSLRLGCRVGFQPTTKP